GAPVFDLPQAGALVAYIWAAAGHCGVHVVHPRLDDPPGDILHAKIDVVHLPVLIVAGRLLDALDRPHILVEGDVTARELTARVPQHLRLDRQTAVARLDGV